MEVIRYVKDSILAVSCVSMKFQILLVMVVLLALSKCQYGYSSFPVRLESLINRRSGLNGSCPSKYILGVNRLFSRQEVLKVLQNKVMPSLISNRMKRIAYLDMNNAAEICPSTWSLLTSPVHACGRAPSSVASCDSVTFPSNGTAYSQVCGRIIGYQKGSPNAFNSSVRGGANLENSYIDGVSLTNGKIGSRQHIWSFVNAYYETGSTVDYICPCMNSNWPHQVPSFIGEDYFCATGNHGNASYDITFYADDPLWDGEGCGPSSTCCKLNNPPWFCKTLPRVMSDDLEVRICGDQEVNNENTYVSFIDIYVR